MISANVLSGPFEEPFAEAMFESIKALVDEIIVVDTAPENNPNYAVNKKYATKLVYLPRGKDKNFSFAEAREIARLESNYDWVLRIDQDEVLHENCIPRLKRITDSEYWSNIEVSFYHFMLFPWLYQYIEPKIVLMKTNSFSWVGGVHETPQITGRIKIAHDIKYHHYGYLRGQKEVFDRWKLYTDIDNKPNWYDGVNPRTILDDRIPVCQNFPPEGHPTVVHSTLDKLFPLWQQKP